MYKRCDYVLDFLLFIDKFLTQTIILTTSKYQGKSANIKHPKKYA